MENVLRVVTKFFTGIFVADYTGSSSSLLTRILLLIRVNTYLYIGVVLVIVGFSVSVIKRIIHS